MVKCFLKEVDFKEDYEGGKKMGEAERFVIKTWQIKEKSTMLEQ